MRSFIKTLLYFLSFLFHRNNDSRVVYYHDVGTRYTEMGTDLSMIQRHVRVIRVSGYQIVPEIKQRRGEVMMCFDDGWAGLYDERSFFLREGICPTVFLAVDLIGSPGYLSLDQIKELQGLGFRFEGHGWSHQDLTLFDDESLGHEIAESKEELSKLLGKPVEAICFPLGRFSDKVIQVSKESGYSRLFSSLPGGYFDRMGQDQLICRNLVQNIDGKSFYYLMNSRSPFFFRRALKQHYKR